MAPHKKQEAYELETAAAVEKHEVKSNYGK